MNRCVWANGHARPFDRRPVGSGRVVSVCCAAAALAHGAIAWRTGVGRLCPAVAQGQTSNRVSLRARQGTTLDVEIFGDDIQDVTRLHCSHPGITAERVPDQAGKPLQFKVNVGAEIPLGYYDARLVTRLGVTNPRTFAVGELPEVVEQEPNNDASHATRVEIGTVINGRSLPSEDVDLFVFSAKAGQRVLIECRGKRLDSNLDGFLWLYDSAGRQLASNQDDSSRSEKTDPLIDFTIPADGDYFVKIADFVYNGSNTCFYRLTVSTLPLIDFVLPTGGKPGETRELTLYGRNLPDGEKTDLQIAGRPLEKITRPFAFPPEAATTLPLTQMEVIRPYTSCLNGAAVAYHSGGQIKFQADSRQQHAGNSGARAERFAGRSATSDRAGRRQRSVQPCQGRRLLYLCRQKGRGLFDRSLRPADRLAGRSRHGSVHSKGAVMANPQDDGENIGQLRFRTPSGFALRTHGA